MPHCTHRRQRGVNGLRLPCAVPACHEGYSASVVTYEEHVSQMSLVSSDPKPGDVVRWTRVVGRKPCPHGTTKGSVACRADPDCTTCCTYHWERA